MIELRHEWLQKEATPGTPGGDFRWYPGVVDADLRAAMAGRAGDGGQAVWQIEPDRVAWAVSYSAVAAADKRRYIGLALTVVEGDAPASALLAAIDVLPAAPWRDQAVARAVPVKAAAPYTAAPRAIDPATAATLAHALWSGGSHAIAAPTDAALPGLLATLSTWLPLDVDARARHGVLVPAAPAVAAPPLHHYLGQAWALPAAIAARDPGLGRRAWCAALGLAARAGLSPDQVFEELAGLARAWNTADELAAYLAAAGVITADEERACDARAPAPLRAAADAGRLWARVMHYWGRGFLDGDGVEARLARLLSRRVVADHLFHLDAPAQPRLPMRYVRRLQREAILPRERVDRILARVAAEVPEVLHG